MYQRLRQVGDHHSLIRCTHILHSFMYKSEGGLCVSHATSQAMHGIENEIGKVVVASIDGHLHSILRKAGNPSVSCCFGALAVMQNVQSIWLHWVATCRAVAARVASEDTVTSTQTPHCVWERGQFAKEATSIQVGLDTAMAGMLPLALHVPP